jgi:hypothetical protein
MYVLTELLFPTSVLAFHPDDFTSDAALQCVVCNASYYCKNGERYACPTNSIAIQYADSSEECVCNPGYLRSNFEWSKSTECPCGSHDLCTGCDAGKFQTTPGLTSASTCQQCGAYTRSTRFQTGLLTKASRYLGCADTTTRLRGSKSAECWMRMPTGCSKPLGETSTPLLWFLDPYAVSADGCFWRSQEYNNYCERSNAEYDFRTKWLSLGTTVANWLNPDVCFGYEYYAFECGELFCLTSAQFPPDSLTIPDGNCVGQPSLTPTVNGGRNDHCVAPTNPNIGNDGTALGGYHRAAVYKLSDPSVLSCVCPRCIDCTDVTCNLGLSPYWYLYGQRNSCPATKGVYWDGSSTVEDCVCLPGFYSQPNRSSACLPCPKGTFADKHNMSQCTPCPANSWHDSTQQTNISACLCNAGWAGDSVSGCVECAAGSFSPVNGSAACQVCRNNSGTYDFYPRTECKCHRGFFGIGTSACVECPQHTWEDEVGSTACKSCKIFLQSPGGATEHKGQTSSDSCFCLPGYLSIVVDGARACQACSPGTFHVQADNMRNESCQNCSYGTYANASAATVCTNCPVNSTTYVFPYTACQCHAGYSCSTYPQLTWEQISYGETGSWAFSNYNDNPLLNIQYDSGQYGTWRNLELVAFWKQFNVVIPTPSTPNPNPEWKGIYLIIFDQLPECFLDFSNHPCKVANRNGKNWITYNTHGGLLVFKFYMVYYPVNSILYTVHGQDAGPHPRTVQVDGFQWLQCGSQFNSIGCLPFDGNPNHLFTAAFPGQRVWPNSLFGIQKMLKQNPAECPDGTCQACSVGTFKDYTGPAIHCKLCQPGAISPVASVLQSQCNCSAGYFRNSSTSCPSCAGGYYSVTQDVPECTKCPEHTFTDPVLHPWNLASDCRACKLCNASTNPAFTDHYDSARGGSGCGDSSVEVCTQCPSLSSLFRPTTESERNFGVRSCVCDENSYGLVGTACTACPVGQNRTGFIYDNTTLHDCQCTPGYEPDRNIANLCSQCPIGKYKPEVGDHNCSVCPDTFTTEVTGNSKFSDCVCKPGYALSAEQVCVICPENTHKEGFNLNTTCNSCTANSFGASGGTGPSECSCLQGFDNDADVCNLCQAGKFKNTTVSIREAKLWVVTSPSDVNMARGRPVTGTAQLPDPNWYFYRLTDGFTNGGAHTQPFVNAWMMIDMQQTVSVGRVRIYNRQDCCADRFDNFQIRVGNSETSGGISNPACISNALFFVGFKDLNCVLNGRYLTVQQFNNQPMNLMEIEVYSSVTSADKVAKNGLYACDPCRQNTFMPDTGSLACDACPTGKTTDGRTGQVECVCDVGTEPGADSICQTCRAGKYKATTTDKYANRACVNCSSCAANQQVNTECNNTHDITCKACQANSWSFSGRKLLDPCFCNAGYELQGGLCVACPVGKARQVNANNSIRCEVCGPDSFTNTIATVSCKGCAILCQAQAIIVPTKVSTGQVLSEDIQSFIGAYSLRIASPAALGSSTAGVQPSYFSQGGYFNKPFLRFSKTSATAGHAYISSGGSVSTSNGITIVFVVRIQSTITSYSGMDTSFFSMQRGDEFHALSVNLRTISGILNLCVSTWTGGEACARADAPLNTWIKVSYVYHPSSSPRHKLQVEYTSSSGVETVSTGTGNGQIESFFTMRKCAFGTSVSAGCATYHSFVNLYNYASCDRPIFDVAGFHFLQTRASDSDVSVLLQAIADGLQLHPRVLRYENFDFYVRHECNASRDVICQQCQTCRQGFFANNTCGANYSNDRLDTQCVSCPEDAFCPGTASFQQPLLCSEQRCGANQQVATLCNTTHNVTCKACQANSWSYAGRTAIEPCLCNAGYELQGWLCVACPVGKARQANINNSIVCETCPYGTFTSVSTTVSCGMCSEICDKPCAEKIYDFSQVAIGQPWKDYAAAIGFPPSTMFSWDSGCGGWMGQWNNNAWMQGTLPPEYSSLEVTFYAACANAGSAVGTVVLSIDGVPKATSYGDTVVYKQKYSAGQILRIQEFSAYHNGGIGKNLKITLQDACVTYVRHECNASRDVICQQCQTCRPGFYANNTCGANYSNDRLDTQCVPCPAGSYCPTGTGPPILCPDNGKSPLGSDDLKDCDCDPGYFRDVDGCSLCHFDYYCLGKQIQYAIACPQDSRTARRGSTSRLDCHCHTGYFRDPPDKLDSFNCSLCLPGDFCFNNSAYNCSDALMVSAPGSGFFDNCTCVSGYYNNGTVCEDCPANYYCEGGKRLSCPANEWTAYERRSYECVCMPGFYREQTVCVPCTDNYYCDGLDDSRQACPSNAVSNLAVGIENCLCQASYEAIFSSNVSEPHYCQLCAHTHTFKSTIGNSACLPCTECLPQLHSAWTQIECTTNADALCDTCTVCYNASLGFPRSQYTTQACQQFFDAECANCSVCEWSSEWELAPCSETEDATCSPITFQRQCPVGFYAGGHTHTSDSQCLPCAVRNTPYEGQWLHEFTSAGNEYNNRYSCDLQCLPFSRLVNTSDTSFGCTSCETGNVLFKIFTQNMFACSFECLEGYVSVNGDCVLGATDGNELTFWNHSLNVTHVRREEERNNSGSGAFLVTVSHTSHGHFAVVVGPTEPTCAGLSQATFTKTALSACCFNALWRVSSTNQLGLPTAGSESCSRQNAPWSTTLADTQLQFEIPDTRMEEIGSCDVYGEVLSCVVMVSIVDIILLQHFSVRLRLEISRSSSLAITSTETYVPLSSIRVEAQLAYRETDGSPVFVVVTDMAPLEGAGITEVLLFGTGLALIQPASHINCARFAVGNVSNVSTDAWTLKTNYARATTFLRAIDKTTVFIKLFYTLRLRERESSTVKNTMHIAVWRNISTTHTVCEEEMQPLVVRTGQVLSCSGLGESAVAASTLLELATDTVHGEVGGLTSFIARALHEHVRTVRAVNMLLAFSLPPVVLHGNLTHMRMGTLEFTDNFRAECAATHLCHFRYAHKGNGMYFMTSCDTESQTAARSWLRLALGVVHDAGHVMQLCRLAQWQVGNEYAFLITLVNTRAYLPPAEQWHDLQNRSAPASRSNVFALFEFV